MSQKIICRQTHYRITDVEDIPESLAWKFGYYDKLYHRMVYPGLLYLEDEEELRIPRAFSLKYIQTCFPDHEVEWDNDPDEYDKLDIKITSKPKSELQAHLLAFCAGRKPYRNFAKASQKLVDADTGEGKTWTGITNGAYKKCATVVFIPSTNTKIGKQWEESAPKFTSTRPHEILFVRGGDMCEKIMRGELTGYNLYIIPRSTVTALVRKYDSWLIIDRLVKAMRVGLKIVDEVHMDFDTVVNIDMVTNVKHNLYMSATPNRSDKDGKRIFKNVFGDVARCGSRLKTSEENHINVVNLFYNSTPSREQISGIRVKGIGPSPTKYADYLMDEEGAKAEFVDAFLFALHLHLRARRGGGKILVMCSKLEFIQELISITKEFYPYLSIGNYTGSGKKKDDELDNELIFSTTRSMGTGSEIENHQCTINVVLYASSVLGSQLPGRNRQYEGRKSIYTEIVNKSHPTNYDMYKRHKPALAGKAVDGVITEYEINQNDIDAMYRMISKGIQYNSNGVPIKNGRFYVGHRQIK